MTDKKYTLTEEQLRVVYDTGWLHGYKYGVGTGSDKADYSIIATLTPDPQPSGDVVERIADALYKADDGEYKMYVEDLLPMARSIAPLIEAEVQRRMEPVEGTYLNDTDEIVYYKGFHNRQVYVLTPKGAKHE